MKSRQREILKMVERAGLQCLAVSITGGSHYRAELQRPSGGVRKFFFASTPGDVRSDKNQLAELRRFAATGEVR